METFQIDQEVYTMGLFDKKDCAICGGKVKGLLPWKVDGQHICNSCYGTAHIQQDILDSMSVEQFKEYMVFREENQKKKDVFTATQRFDLTLFGTKITFDDENNLFCMNADLSTTIFDGSQIESFVIREDRTPLFASTAEGLQEYASFVPDRALALEPMAHRIRTENAHRGPNDNVPYRDIPEPFQRFAVEIRMKNHPYWQVLTAEMDGPIFDNTNPDVNRYLREYDRDAKQMYNLAIALMDMMERAGEAPETPAPAAEPAVPAEPAPEPVPAAEPAPASSFGDTEAILEIKRYKELLDQGIITEEEFAAKKKQIMGI